MGHGEFKKLILGVWDTSHAGKSHLVRNSSKFRILFHVIDAAWRSNSHLYTAMRSAYPIERVSVRKERLLIRRKLLKITANEIEMPPMHG